MDQRFMRKVHVKPVLEAVFAGIVHVLIEIIVTSPDFHN